MEILKEKLRTYKLKATPVRLKVLEALSNSPKALSHSELDKKFNDLDRVSIYRTLYSFEEKGLIHRVIDANGGVRYSTCKSNCSTEKHYDHHLHFSCSKCDKTICLDQVSTPPPSKIPEGFLVNNYYTLATGVCNTCS